MSDAPSLAPSPETASTAAAVLLGVALCLLAAWLHPTLFRGALDDPISHASNDDWDWQLVTWEASRVQWLDGQLPTWCPWVGGGVPLLGNPESPALFPGFIAVLLFGTYGGMKLLLLAQWWLLVLGGWLAGRSVGLSRVTAHFGSLALLASSFLPEFIGWGHQMFLGICWLPLAFAAQRSGRWSLAGVLLAMPLLQGAHYIFFFGVLWLGLDALLRALDPGRLRWLVPGLALNALWLAPPSTTWQVSTVLVGALLLVGVLQQRRSSGADEPADSLLPLLATLLVAGLLVLPKVVASAELVGVSVRMTRTLAATALNAEYSAVDAWRVLTGLVERPAGHEGQNVLHHWFPVLAGLLGLVLAAWRRPSLGVLGLTLWCCGWADATPVNLLEAVHRAPGFDLLAKIERYSLVWTLFLGWGMGYLADQLWTRSRAVTLIVYTLGTALWLAAALPHALHDIRSVDLAPTEPPGEFVQRRGGAMPGFESVRANQGRLDLSIAAPPDEPAPGLRGVGEPGYRGEAYFAEGTQPVSSTVAGSQVLIETDSGGSVRLNQSWYPGWRIDGRPTRSEDGLIAADLEPGAHRFHYWPRGLTLALALHAAGWILAAYATRRGR